MSNQQQQQTEPLPWRGNSLDTPVAESLDFLYKRIERLEQVNASLMHRMMALDPTIAMLPCLACGQQPENVKESDEKHPEHSSLHSFNYTCGCYDGDTQTLWTDDQIGFTEAWNAVTQEWLRGVLSKKDEEGVESRA